MKILILEGISTSGKSTVINLLEKMFEGPKVKVLKENQTHVPIMKQTSEHHQEFFVSLINEACNNKPGCLIIDRLHLTQAFRAQISLGAYSKLENLLAKHQTLTIFLKVDEASIADRVTKTASHRNTEWNDHIRSKGKSPKEVADYYISQQRNQLQLLESSKIPYKIFDTTHHNYDEIASEIKNHI